MVNGSKCHKGSKEEKAGELSTWFGSQALPQQFILCNEKPDWEGLRLDLLEGE